MIPKIAIANIVAKQRKMLADIPAGHPREMMSSMPYLSERVLLIGGMRGCGRTTLLHRMLNDEYAEAWYTDFDDPRLAGFDGGDFAKLDRLIDDSGKGVLLLNKVDNASAWLDFLKAKTEQGVKVIATVSLSTLLRVGQEARPGGSLPDIFVTRRLEPFSYTEFLDFTHKKGGEATVGEYLLRGSMPGSLRQDDPNSLRRLYGETIIRDAIVAGGVRDRDTLQRVALHLIAGSGDTVTANKLREKLKIKAVSTAAEHMQLTEQAGLVSFIPILSDNPARQAVNPRRVYAADTALIAALSTEVEIDRERLFGALIFNSLKCKNTSICYTSQQGGCDFVAVDADGIVRCIQACYDDDPDRMQTKTEGLLWAMRETGVRKGTIVTLGLSDRIAEGDFEIEVTDADTFLRG